MENMTKSDDKTCNCNDCGSGTQCNCVHHKVVPGAIVLIGAVFLLNAFEVFTPSVTAIAWPALLVVIGVVKFKEGSCKCC